MHDILGFSSHLLTISLSYLTSWPGLNYPTRLEDSPRLSNKNSVMSDGTSEDLKSDVSFAAIGDGVYSRAVEGLPRAFCENNAGKYSIN